MWQRKGCIRYEIFFENFVSGLRTLKPKTFTNLKSLNNLKNKKKQKKLNLKTFFLKMGFGEDICRNCAILGFF